jgi:hypothetical protein
VTKCYKGEKCHSYKNTPEYILPSFSPCAAMENHRLQKLRVVLAAPLYELRDHNRSVLSYFRGQADRHPPQSEKGRIYRRICTKLEEVMALIDEAIDAAVNPNSRRRMWLALRPDVKVKMADIAALLAIFQPQQPQQAAS